MLTERRRREPSGTACKQHWQAYWSGLGSPDLPIVLAALTHFDPLETFVEQIMAKHAPRFLQLVNEVKPEIRECTVEDVKNRLARGEDFHLVDVREESEWAGGHLPTAVHLGKGVIERDVEQQFPDSQAELVLYCGGGFRSALAAHNLQRMGYQNVISMDGGFRGWKDAGLPLVQPLEEG